MVGKNDHLYFAQLILSWFYWYGWVL